MNLGVREGGVCDQDAFRNFKELLKIGKKEGNEFLVLGMNITQTCICLFILIDALWYKTEHTISSTPFFI